MSEKAEENPAKDEKRPGAWQASRGPIIADRYSLQSARDINALLVLPIAVLPKTEGDIVMPFKVGISADLEALLKPDVAVVDLRKALRRYTHSAGYLYASAQPDACRHDIDGVSIEPVSERDRANARQSFLVVQEKRKERRAQREAEALSSGVEPATGTVKPTG